MTNMDHPPVDHGADRYDYVEIEAPDGIDPTGAWWEAVVAEPCADCRANLFVKWLGNDQPSSSRAAWHLTVAHDDGCPRLTTLPQPAHWFRGSYCSYCIHTRAEHGGDEGICVRCITDGNGFWPLCPAFTRTAKTPDEHPGLRAEGT